MIALIAASSVSFVVLVLISIDRADFGSVYINQTGLLAFPFSSFANDGILNDPQNSAIDGLRQLARAKTSRTSDSNGNVDGKNANAIFVTFPENKKSGTIGESKSKNLFGSDRLSQSGQTSFTNKSQAASESLGQVKAQSEAIFVLETQRKNKNVLITSCTVVLNETAYIVEWIEFMRLQGVERFVIYDDGSTDNISMLPEFYRQHDPTVEVIVLPAVFSGPVKSGWSYVDQKRNLQHCLDTFKNSTEWILVSDADEFIYSPTYGSLRNVTVRADEMGIERNMTVSNIYFHCVRFGTGGQKRRFHNALSQTSSGEIAYTNGCGVELIVDHIYRGRFHVHEDGGPAPAYCEKPLHFDLHCNHGFGKSMFRARDVLIPDVHTPAEFREDVEDKSKYRTHDLGFCNHYYIRSREDVEKKANNVQPSKYAPGMYMTYFDATDEAVYGRFNSPHGLARKVVALWLFHDFAFENLFA